jgi:hypothetical protein
VHDRRTRGLGDLTLELGLGEARSPTVRMTSAPVMVRT